MSDVAINKLRNLHEKKGDVVLSINNKPVMAYNELQAKIDSIPDAKPIKHAPSVIKEADLASMRPVELYRYKKQLN